MILRPLGEAAVGDREDVLLLDVGQVTGLDVLGCLARVDQRCLGRLLGGDLLGADDRHRQHRVAVAELHAGDAGRRPPHRPQLGAVGLEPDRLTLAGDQQDVVVGVDQLGADQLVRPNSGSSSRKLIAMTPAWRGLL